MHCYDTQTKLWKLSSKVVVYKSCDISAITGWILMQQKLAWSAESGLQNTRVLESESSNRCRVLESEIHYLFQPYLGPKGVGPGTWRGWTWDLKNFKLKGGVKNCMLVGAWDLWRRDQKGLGPGTTVFGTWDPPSCVWSGMWHRGVDLHLVECPLVQYIYTGHHSALPQTPSFSVYITIHSSMCNIKLVEG
jgi:hypothetical protein